MGERLPLSALLSQTLVAFTIEFDNEAEHRMPHSTTEHGATAGSVPGARYAPWLVSMAMWWNCMRFVSDDGVTVRELERLARTGTNLDGMRRWGYIRIEPDTAGARSKKPRRDAVVRPTAAGRMAQEVWRPLCGVIEQRWDERFGKDTVNRLRDALQTLVSQFDTDLPDCMPILGYGLLTKISDEKERGATGKDRSIERNMPLAALLAKTLVAFALEFERASEVSLAICANVLRVTGDEGVRVRDLARLSGVSKEAVAMALSFLEKKGYAAVKPEFSGSKVKALVLTPKGQILRTLYRELMPAIEGRWQTRFGENAIRTLRDVLEESGAGAPAKTSRLFEGLEPYPDGWRAAVRKPETLPHFPMVLHRGGYPDGG
jgi:DNA-binding MarR family transcriptional regulator